MAESKAEEIGLAKFLAQVRMEIEAAQAYLADSGKPALLDWTEAELEISFEVKREVDAKGGVKFYVFAVEAGGKYSSEQVHKLKLKLKPSEGPSAAVAE
jgi:hypothetical protein